MNSKTVFKYMEFVPNYESMTFNQIKAYVQEHKWTLQKKYFQKYPAKLSAKGFINNDYGRRELT